jgi:hypothetical protein
VFSLADLGFSAGASKGMLLGAAAVLLILVGVAVGLRAAPRAAESPNSMTEPVGAG